MLVGKGQSLDLKEIRLTQQAVDINRQSMSGQFAVQASTQAPKGMGVVLFNAELPRQLTVHCFDQLTDCVVKVFERFGNLLFLVGTGDGTQQNAVFLPQFSSFWRTDVAFVSQHLQIRMIIEQFETGFQIGAVGRSQFKIQDQTAHRNEQMQTVAEEGLLFRDSLAKRGVIGFPVAR